MQVNHNQLLLLSDKLITITIITLKIVSNYRKTAFLSIHRAIFETKILDT